MHDGYFITWQFSIPPKKSSPRASEEAAAERTVAEACGAEKNGCQEEMAVFILSAWAESSYDTLTHREQARPDAQMGDEQRASCCKVKCPLSPCLRELDIDYTASSVIPLPIKLLLFESYQLECFFSGKDQAGLGCSRHWKWLLPSLCEVYQEGEQSLESCCEGERLQCHPSPHD